jgi:hypothetical protein
MAKGCIFATKLGQSTALTAAIMYSKNVLKILFIQAQLLRLEHLPPVVESS